LDHAYRTGNHPGGGRGQHAFVGRHRAFPAGRE